MLPDEAKFAAAMTALGLGDGMRFVVYDSHGLFAAARVWWTLRAFGAAEVTILDGGLPQWLAEGRPIEPATPRRSRAAFTPQLDPAFVASLDDVRRTLAAGAAQVVDARPAERFEGRAAEPRPGVRSGHIPGSLNLPFVEIVEHGRLKRGAALAAAFAAREIDLARPIVTTCGSGVTAADRRPGGRGGGRPGRRTLRRLLVRMGRARRLPGRHWPGVARAPGWRGAKAGDPGAFRPRSDPFRGPKLRGKVPVRKLKHFLVRFCGPPVINGMGGERP